MTNLAFKSWLQLTEMEEHPFVAWHNQYKNLLDQEKKYRQMANDNYWATRRARFKGQPEPQLAKMVAPTVKSYDMLAQQKSLFVTPIIRISGFSSGIHGFGDQPDEPAGDPSNDAEWNISNMSINQEQKLVGKTALITQKSQGSYHEQWYNLEAYVITENGTQRLDPGLYGHIIQFFKFESIEKTAALLQTINPGLSNPAKDGETSEEYWKRLRGTVASPAPNLNPDDDYDDRDDYYKYR